MEDDEKSDDDGAADADESTDDNNNDGATDTSAIVGTPQKSPFSLFLHQTSVTARKPLSVAELEYNKFDRTFESFPTKLALLIRSDREGRSTELMIIHSIQRHHSLSLWGYIDAKRYTDDTAVTLRWNELTEPLSKTFYLNNASATDATGDARLFFRSPTNFAKTYFNKLARADWDPNLMTGNIFLRTAPQPGDYSEKDTRKWVFPGVGVFIEQALASDIIDISDVDDELGFAYILPEKVLSLLLPRICTWTKATCTKMDHLLRFL